MRVTLLVVLGCCLSGASVSAFARDVPADADGPALRHAKEQPVQKAQGTLGGGAAWLAASNILQVLDLFVVKWQIFYNFEV